MEMPITDETPHTAMAPRTNCGEIVSKELRNLEKTYIA